MMVTTEALAIKFTVFSVMTINISRGKLSLSRGNGAKSPSLPGVPAQGMADDRCILAIIKSI